MTGRVRKLFKKKEKKQTSDRESEWCYVIVRLKHQSGAGEESIVQENKWEMWMKKGGEKGFQWAPQVWLDKSNFGSQSVLFFFFLFLSSIFVSIHVWRIIKCVPSDARVGTATKRRAQATAQSLGVTQVFPHEWVGGRLRGWKMDRFQF